MFQPTVMSICNIAISQIADMANMAEVGRAESGVPTSPLVRQGFSPAIPAAQLSQAPARFIPGASGWVDTGGRGPRTKYDLFPGLLPLPAHFRVWKLEDRAGPTPGRAQAWAGV